MQERELDSETVLATLFVRDWDVPRYEQLCRHHPDMIGKEWALVVLLARGELEKIDDFARFFTEHCDSFSSIRVAAEIFCVGMAWTTNVRSFVSMRELYLGRVASEWILARLFVLGRAWESTIDAFSRFRERFADAAQNDDEALVELFVSGGGSEAFAHRFLAAPQLKDLPARVAVELFNAGRSKQDWLEFASHQSLAPNEP